jgi:hypothetical protein
MTTGHSEKWNALCTILWRAFCFLECFRHCCMEGVLFSRMLCASLLCGGCSIFGNAPPFFFPIFFFFPVRTCQIPARYHIWGGGGETGRALPTEQGITEISTPLALPHEGAYFRNTLLPGQYPACKDLPRNFQGISWYRENFLVKGGHSERAPSNASSTGCLLLLSCG